MASPNPNESSDVVKGDETAHVVGYQFVDAENEMEVAQQSYNQSWKDTVKLIEDDNTVSMRKNLYIYVMIQHMGDNHVVDVDNQDVDAETSRTNTLTLK